jgi:hypothetical protein
MTAADEHRVVRPKRQLRREDLKSILHRSPFLKELKATFPGLRAELNAQHGLLHLEMHAFHAFAQQAIALGNERDVRLCFMLAEKYYKAGNRRLKNAIVVSFVEHLDLYDSPWAWRLLSVTLREVYLRCVELGGARSLPYPAA